MAEGGRPPFPGLTEEQTAIRDQVIAEALTCKLSDKELRSDRCRAIISKEIAKIKQEIRYWAGRIPMCEEKLDSYRQAVQALGNTMSEQGQRLQGSERAVGEAFRFNVRQIEAQNREEFWPALREIIVNYRNGLCGPVPPQFNILLGVVWQNSELAMGQIERLKEIDDAQTRRRNRLAVREPVRHSFVVQPFIELPSNLATQEAQRSQQHQAGEGA